MNILSLFTYFIKIFIPLQMFFELLKRFALKHRYVDVNSVNILLYLTGDLDQELPIKCHLMCRKQWHVI